MNEDYSSSLGSSDTTWQNHSTPAQFILPSVDSWFVQNSASVLLYFDSKKCPKKVFFRTVKFGFLKPELSRWETGDGDRGRRRVEDVEDGWRDGRERMGGAERLSDVNWTLQQSICTAGFSKQFPDDGGGVTERKRQKKNRQCSHKICLVSEQLYLIFLVTILMSVVFLLMPVQHSSQSILAHIIFCCIIMWRVELVKVDTGLDPPLPRLFCVSEQETSM